METNSFREALGIRATGGGPWWREAACRGMQLQIFFVEKGSQRDDGSTVGDDRAKRVCARCPVRRPCLEDAYRAEQPQERTVARNAAEASNRAGHIGRPRPERILPVGVFGGTTPEERWRADVIHESCDNPACKGCRPIKERIDITEEDLRSQLPRLLTRSELANL